MVIPVCRDCYPCRSPSYLPTQVVIAVKRIQARAWVFTLNNPKLTADELSCVLSSKTKSFVFQLEEGASGTPHFQGCFQLSSPNDREVVVKWVDGWWLETCKSWEDSIAYCSKTEGRKGGPWLHNVAIPDKEYRFELKELRPWQREVMERLDKEPDDRSIIWYYDAVGGFGKTSLAKHIVSKYQNDAIYVQGKSNDIKSAIAAMKRKPKIVLFGLPRSLEEFVSYEAIESCKDGLFFSGKYESGMVLMKPPHVFIFANFLPEMAKLSADRWVIVNLNSQPFETSSRMLTE